MKRLLRHAAQIVPALLSLALLAFVLRTADLRRALGLVNAFGWFLPLLLLPNVLAVLTELAGWWLSLGRLGPRPRYLALLARAPLGRRAPIRPAIRGCRQPRPCSPTC